MLKNKKALLLLILFLPVIFIVGQNTETQQSLGPILVNILRGLFGIAILVGIAWCFSANRKAVNWSLVIKGLVLQFVLAILILKVPYIDSSFEWVGKVFTKITGFSESGAIFLFGDLGIPKGSLGFYICISNFTHHPFIFCTHTVYFIILGYCN